jgi:peptidoglycan/LPS O-acetylase OafA/YrhL
MPIALTVGYLLVPYFTEMGQRWALLAMSVGTLVVVLPAAAISYRFIEVPMNRWAKTVTKRLQENRDSSRALAVD